MQVSQKTGMKTEQALSEAETFERRGSLENAQELKEMCVPHLHGSSLTLSL